MPLYPTDVKQYIALLEQTGTNAPLATILLNTLGDIIWSYTTTGTYKGTLTNGFPKDQTTITISNSNPTVTYNAAANNEHGEPSDEIIIITKDNTGTYQDDRLYLTTIEIKVYNIQNP